MNTNELENNITTFIEARTVAGNAFTTRSAICKYLNLIEEFDGYGVNPLMSNVTVALNKMYGERYLKVEIDKGVFRKAVIH